MFLNQRSVPSEQLPETRLRKPKKKERETQEKLATCGFSESRIQLYKDMFSESLHETASSKKIQIRDASQAEELRALVRKCSDVVHTGAKLVKIKEFAKLIKFNKTSYTAQYILGK